MDYIERMEMGETGEKAVDDGRGLLPIEGQVL